MKTTQYLLALLLVVGPVALAEPDPVEKNHGLAVHGDRFRYNSKLIDVYGIRCASALGTEAYAEHLISQLDSYKAHGVNAVTVFYQGSSGGHYDPFTSDGKGWRFPGFRDRMDQIIEACAQRDMIVFAGIFYQWKNTELTDRSLADWSAARGSRSHRFRSSGNEALYERDSQYRQ